MKPFTKTGATKPDAGKLGGKGGFLPFLPHLSRLFLFPARSRATTGRAPAATRELSLNRRAPTRDTIFHAKIRTRRGDIETLQILLPGNTPAESLLTAAALALELQHDLIAPTVIQVSRHRPGTSPGLCRRDQLLARYRNTTATGATT